MKSLVSSINRSLGTSGNASLVSALSSAMRGDFRQAQNLNIGALTTLDPSSFSSAEDLAIQQALNQNRLETISDLASKQLTESEIAISAINREIESIENTSSNEISALENQLKTLLNIDDSVLSVADAIETFKTEQQSLNELNFNVEIKKLDMLISSAEDVFDLHESPRGVPSWFNPSTSCQVYSGSNPNPSRALEQSKSAMWPAILGSKSD